MLKIETYATEHGVVGAVAIGCDAAGCTAVRDRTVTAGPPSEFDQGMVRAKPLGAWTAPLVGNVQRDLCPDHRDVFKTTAASTRVGEFFLRPGRNRIVRTPRAVGGVNTVVYEGVVLVTPVDTSRHAFWTKRLQMALLDQIGRMNQSAEYGTLSLHETTLFSPDASGYRLVYAGKYQRRALMPDDETFRVKFVARFDFPAPTNLLEWMMRQAIDQMAREDRERMEMFDAAEYVTDVLRNAVDDAKNACDYDRRFLALRADYERAFCEIATATVERKLRLASVGTTAFRSGKPLSITALRAALERFKGEIGRPSLYHPAGTFPTPPADAKDPT